MPKILVIICCLAVVIAGAFVWKQKNQFELSSMDVKQNQMLAAAQVYNAHGCNGKNMSPQLSWANAPKQTKSFAIVCHDPDAPHPNGWYHWLVVNIPPIVTAVNGGGKIAGALETVTSFNEKAYGGACPPVGHGVHHYHFTIYALDVEKLDVLADTPPFEVEQKIKQHALAQATITGLYERKSPELDKVTGAKGEDLSSEKTAHAFVEKQSRAYAQAVAMIKNGQASAVVVKDDKIAAQESGKGIKPLLTLLDEQPLVLSGASLVDKVIGRAAAFIAIKGQVRAVYGELMSEEALKLLQTYHVHVAYDQLVPQILNRAKDGLCPMEQTVLKAENPDEAVSWLRAKVADIAKTRQSAKK